ncbi:MAG TPA: PQQ-binding-like beta-propeller repeat protein [Phycisphaerae bacterium]|nr:PQQ-binding-like beta-propeller repeat protein [Phycisphaerae bacterium]
MLEAVNAIMALLSFGPVPAQAALQTLEPIWTRQLEQQIEWVAAVGDSTSPALLVCTSTAALLVIEAETGQTRFSTPVQAGPGVRLAQGEGEDTVYCYDRFSAYALTLRESPAARHAAGPLLWQAGEWALPPAGYRGDPEFLTRVVAGHVTLSGLLVARSDGRVALLARENGDMRWDCRLPRLPDCRLHVCDRTAALVFKEADELKAAFFELDSDRPQPVVRTLGDTWPIWTKLIPNQRLVAVGPESVVIAEPTAPLFNFRPDVGGPLRASAIDVYAPGEPDPGALAERSSSEQSALLVTVGAERLCAYDLSTGESVWSDEAGQQPAAPVMSLRVHDDMVIATTPRSFEVRRAVSGEAVGGYVAEESPFLVTATVVGDFGYGLFRGPASEGATGREQWLVLTRVALPPPYRKPPATQAIPCHAQFRLDHSEPIRQVLWVGRRLVLVEQKRLRAYTLP